jgi:serine/threonine-protein kinase HipA
MENEWICMNLLAEFGLPVAKTEILTFGSQKVLCVERFHWQPHSTGSWVTRLAQEGHCQIMGAPSPLNYESDVGPDFVDMAAPDEHAKNFSNRVLVQGRCQLTPL